MFLVAGLECRPGTKLIGRNVDIISGSFIADSSGLEGWRWESRDTVDM